MENFVEHPTCSITPPPASSPHLTFRNTSRAISKSKPKVRIIHIFAPEIIETDVANFRELVQRLTGKPTPRDRARRNSKSRRRPRAAKRLQEDMIISVSGENPAPAPAPTNRLVEFRRGFFNREEGVIKEEGDHDHVYGDDQLMWVDRNHDHNTFGDFDGLIQELGHDDQFSFLQNSDVPNYNLHGFVEQAH